MEAGVERLLGELILEVRQATAEVKRLKAVNLEMLAELTEIRAALPGSQAPQV